MKIYKDKITSDRTNVTKDLKKFFKTNIKVNIVTTSSVKSILEQVELLFNSEPDLMVLELKRLENSNYKQYIEICDNENHLKLTIQINK